MDEPLSPEPADHEYAGARPVPFQVPVVSTSPLRLVPVIGDLRRYTRGLLRADVIAGVAMAAVAIPQSMAYAQTAGLPVVAGLYGLLLPLLAYALLGSSRNLVTGPTATTALMVAPALVAISSEPADYPALAAMMALLVAAVFVLARVLRLGWIADYFSTSVLLGFLTGLALTLLAGQLDEFTGVPVEGDTPLQEYASFLTGFVGQVDALELLIGSLCLAALVIGSALAAALPHPAGGHGAGHRLLVGVRPRRAWRDPRRRDPAGSPRHLVAERGRDAGARSSLPLRWRSLWSGSPTPS